MDEQTLKSRRNMIRIAFIVLLAVLVGFLLYSGIVVKKITMAYRIVLAAGVIIIFLLQNIIAPKALGEFDEKTQSQMVAYRKMAALSFVGYLGLIYFGIAVDRSTGFYGALVYLMAVMLRRRFADEYNLSPEEAAQAEAEAAAAREEAQEQSEAGTENVLQMDASTRLQRLMSTVDQDEDELPEAGEETDGSV